MDESEAEDNELVEMEVRMESLDEEKGQVVVDENELEENGVEDEG